MGVVNIKRHRFVIRSVALAVGVGVSIILIPEVRAQRSERTTTQSPSYYFYSPVEGIAARIHANADLIRAVGDASVNHATAREIRAAAYRKEIANSVYKVEAYWKRKAIFEEARRLRKFDRSKSKRIQNSKQWERLKNSPELSGPEIENGKALNFLLTRLSTTMLAYKFSLAETPDDPELVRQLKLSPNMLGRIQLSQRRTNGDNFVFTANEGIALQVDWWPYTLRHQTFASHRSDFEDARAKVISEATGRSISNKTIDDVDKALKDLKVEYLSFYGKGKSTSRIYGSRMQTWQHVHTGKVFLTSLTGEVNRLKVTGKTDAFDGSLKFEGENLIDLLTYMARNGLVFAPPEKGNESTCYDVFAMMRDVFRTVADEDEGLKVPDDKQDG